MMVLALAAALVLHLATQSADADRTRAVALARSGHTAEALTVFEQIAAARADDVDARLQIARLRADLGQTARAEGQPRAVIGEHPTDIDAHIGLADVLLRR